MPRSNGRGGPRQGKPGVSYPQRTDLNERGFTGQTYGTRQAQIEAVRAVPAAPPPAPQTGPPPVDPNAPKPGSMPDLFGPTDHPDEPVTAGAPVGPGPGPEALGLTEPRQADLQNLAARNLYPFLAWAAARRGGPSTVAFVRDIGSGLT